MLAPLFTETGIMPLRMRRFILLLGYLQYLLRLSPSHLARTCLQPMSVPKARIRKSPFWAFSDVRDRFAHISVGSAQIALKIS
jgi:hypothetical protein